MTEATPAAAPEAPAAATTAPVEQKSTDTAPAEPTTTAEPQAETTTEEAAASDTDTGDDSAADEAKPKKNKGGFQNRIDKLTREKYEAELRNQQLQRELETERRKSNPDLSGDPGPQPLIEQFDKFEKFIAARDEWALKSGASQERKRIEQQKQQEKDFAARAALAAREDAARRKYTDYDAVIAPIGPLLAGHPNLADYAMKSEMAPDVGYHLGKNPAVLLDILKMEPLNQLRELTKIEARLSAAPPPKPLTKAPPPVEPVGSSEKAPKTYETMSMDEYRKTRREERRKRKG